MKAIRRKDVLYIKGKGYEDYPCYVSIFTESAFYISPLIWNLTCLSLFFVVWIEFPPVVTTDLLSEVIIFFLKLKKLTRSELFESNGDYIRV